MSILEDFINMAKDKDYVYDRTEYHSSISKNEFIDLINNYIELTDLADKINELFHGCVYELKTWTFIDNLFHKVLSSKFNQEEIEDIDWWLYEKRGNPDLKYFIDKKEIPAETVEDLWNILCAKTS